MTTRYYAETPCEHGRLGPHSWGGSPVDPGWDQFPDKPNSCPGGQRRELTFVYEKAAQTRVFDDERDWDALTETEQAIELVKAKRVVGAAVAPLESAGG